MGTAAAAPMTSTYRCGIYRATADMKGRCGSAALGPGDRGDEPVVDTGVLAADGIDLAFSTAA